MVERIRNEIARDPIPYKNDILFSIMVTIGIAAYEKGKSIAEMTEEADQKLYYGKRNGKNQVVSVLE